MARSSGLKPDWCILDKTVFIRPPPGIDCPPGMVWRLKKSLYGLWQAPRVFNHFLTNIMVKLGFKATKHDPCLFVLKKGGVCIYVAVFVDDLVVAGSSEAAIEAFKEQMRRHVEIKDLGSLAWCLGVKIEQDLVAGTVSLSQELFVHDVLEKQGEAGDDSAKHGPSVAWCCDLR